VSGIYRQPVPVRRFDAPSISRVGANAEHSGLAVWGAVGSEGRLRHLERIQMRQVFTSAETARFVSAGELTLSLMWRPSAISVIGYYFWQPARPAYYLKAAERERVDIFNTERAIFADTIAAGFTEDQAGDMYDRVECSGVATAMVLDDERCVVWFWVKLGADLIVSHERTFDVQEGTALAERRVEDFRSANNAWIRTHDSLPPTELRD